MSVSVSWGILACQDAIEAMCEISHIFDVTYASFAPGCKSHSGSPQSAQWKLPPCKDRSGLRGSHNLLEARNREGCNLATTYMSVCMQQALLGTTMFIQHKAANLGGQSLPKLESVLWQLHSWRPVKGTWRRAASWGRKETLVFNEDRWLVDKLLPNLIDQRQLPVRKSREMTLQGARQRLISCFAALFVWCRNTRSFSRNADRDCLQLCLWSNARILDW